MDIQPTVSGYLDQEPTSRDDIPMREIERCGSRAKNPNLNYNEEKRAETRLGGGRQRSERSYYSNLRVRHILDFTPRSARRKHKPCD
jgi:hypothetical protein